MINFKWRDMSRSGSGTRTVIEKRLHEMGITLSGTEIGHTESVKKAVEAGLGVSILSKAVVERELGLGWLKTAPLQGMHLKRTFYSIYRKNSYLSKAASTFLSDTLHAIRKA